MNIAQLSEQLKDVPQGTLIGYAKNPNSVVPQFLALAEIQRRQHLQAQAPAPTGTVADDVLAQANPQPVAPQVDPRMVQAMQAQAQQLPENQPGVAQLQSNVAPEGFANGGIVAFAGGGNAMAAGEDDEDYNEYLEKVEKSKRRSSIEDALASLPGIAGGIRSLADRGAEKYKSVMSLLPASLSETRKGITAAASGAADSVEEFLAKLKHLESRGKSFDSKGNILTSSKGAQGSMQVMPKTQLNPGFGVTPARNKSPEELERVGRDYGIAMLNEFKDPKLAAMAYNWGPANVKKWLASDKTLPVPKETLQYRSHFADGGIAKLAAGDLVEDDQYMDSNINTMDRANQALMPDAPVDKFDEFIKQRQEEQAELKKNSKQDAYLALMQAGLGMMSGSSPYALANIGQGGMQGISAYGTLSKQRAAEIAAARKAEGAAVEGQILGDIKRLGIEERSAAAKNALEEKAYSREERNRLLSTKEANDIREAALARFNSEPATKKIAAKLEDLTPGTPEFEWTRQELERQKNNALATAKVPGYTFIPNPSPYPTGNVEAPSAFWQALPFTKNYSKEDMEALEWANANPLDPRANAIKERFK